MLTILMTTMINQDDHAKILHEVGGNKHAQTVILIWFSLLFS